MRKNLPDPAIHGYVKTAELGLMLRLYLPGHELTLNLNTDLKDTLS